MSSEYKQPMFDDIDHGLRLSIQHFIEQSIGNQTVAEDLLQETLIRINRGLSSFAGRSTVKTWAFSIARHIVADYLRHPDQTKNMITLNELEEPLDTESDIDERLVESEMNECIRNFIDTLPEPYRVALILRDLEDFTTRQIAEVCNCSVTTAKVRIHRARAKLRTVLIGQCDFYHDNQNVFRCDPKK
ncbi:RNA polymerase subunit sigma24 [Nitrincola sp. A-D6]|uniref:RNA polymerase sigma factor n=1 Tax=Nitrincola sp. A-D6 TaxID=1545442 RepID=UPI00051FD01D|nr:sigma-70 family RNA polymerase sigma factor [Nitrincola sp. A-D6]KGK42624.1 RNA polymerase subunit sigma24 [Nitrincola sp. A-D6]